MCVLGWQTDEAGPGNLQDLPDGLPIRPPHEASPMANGNGRMEGREHPPADKLPDGAAAAQLRGEDAGRTLPVENGPRGPFAGKLPGTCLGANLPEQTDAGELPQGAPADRLPALARTPHDEVPAAQGREPSRADKTPEAGPEESLTGDLHGRSSKDGARGGVARPGGLPVESGPGRYLPEEMSGVQSMENSANACGALLPGKSASVVEPGLQVASEAHNTRGGVTVSSEELHADSTDGVNPPETSAATCEVNVTPGRVSFETNPSDISTNMPTAGNHIISNAERLEVPNAGAPHSLPQGTPANGPSPSSPLEDTHGVPPMEERGQDSPLADIPLAPRLNSMSGGPAMVALPVSGGLEQFGAVAG
jgi:hypothetical protein